MKCIYLCDNLPQPILFFNINKINILRQPPAPPSGAPPPPPPPPWGGGAGGEALFPFPHQTKSRITLLF